MESFCSRLSPSLFEAGKKGILGVAYDIYFEDDGSVVAVSDTFTVKMLIPGFYVSEILITCAWSDAQKSKD